MKKRNLNFKNLQINVFKNETGLLGMSVIHLPSRTLINCEPVGNSIVKTRKKLLDKLKKKLKKEGLL